MIRSDVLRTLRKRANMSLEELARKSKVSKATLHRLERGQVAKPNATTHKRLARALGVTESQLAGDEPIDEQDRRFAGLLGESTMQVRLSHMARNALTLVSERYKVRQSLVLELAPLLFHIVAGESLRERLTNLRLVQRKQEELRSMSSLIPHAPSEICDPCQEGVDLAEMEEQSIRSLDLFGRDVEHIVAGDPQEDTHAFALAIQRRLKALETAFEDGDDAWDTGGWVSQTVSDHHLDTIIYAICCNEALRIASGSEVAAHNIMLGIAPLHEIPRDLLSADRVRELEEWTEARFALLTQDAKRSGGEVARCKDEPEGAQTAGSGEEADHGTTC